MRHERPEDAVESVELIRGDPDTGRGVHEFDHRRDRGVERESLDVVPHLRDGPVQRPFDVRVGLGPQRSSPVDSSTASRHARWRNRWTPTMSRVFQGFEASSGPIAIS